METLQRPRAQWAPQSLCRTLPMEKVNELFFTEKRGRPSKEPPYMKVCSACPVAYECLNYGIVHDQEGVWGGFTKSQRDRLPKDFVLALKSLAKSQGWFEELPDVDALIRKIRGRRNQTDRLSEELDESWDNIQSPLDTPPVPQVGIRDAEFLELFGF